MLTVIRTLEQHWIENRIAIEAFKIIYVAPMKALAAEIVRKFSTRLASLHVKVRELTGMLICTIFVVNLSIFR